MDFHEYCKPSDKYQIDDSDYETDKTVIKKIDDSDIKLIEEVKGFPCIYVRKKKNEEEVANSWESISYKLNRDVVECQEAWKSLIKACPKERNRREKEGKLAVAELSLYDFMKWIDPYVLRRHTRPRTKISAKQLVRKFTEYDFSNNSNEEPSVQNIPSTNDSCLNNITESLDLQKVCSNDFDKLSNDPQMDDSSQSSSNCTLLEDVQMDNSFNDKNSIVEHPSDFQIEDSIRAKTADSLCNEKITHAEKLSSSPLCNRSVPDASVEDNNSKHSVVQLHADANRCFKEITNKLFEKIDKTVQSEKENECKYDEENHILGRLLINNLRKIDDPQVKAKFKLDITQILYSDDL